MSLKRGDGFAGKAQFIRFVDSSFRSHLSFAPSPLASSRRERSSVGSFIKKFVALFSFIAIKPCPFTRPFSVNPASGHPLFQTDLITSDQVKPDASRVASLPAPLAVFRFEKGG
jgi:hypothetical protein